MVDVSKIMWPVIVICCIAAAWYYFAYYFRPRFEDKGFHVNIIRSAQENGFFRKEIITDRYAQVTVMSLKAGEDIGQEVHHNLNQILVVVSGSGKAVVEGLEKPLQVGDLLYITADTQHNVVNNGLVDLKLYSIYAPPQHKRGTIHQTKADAARAETNENKEK